MYVLLDDQKTQRQLYFRDPQRVLIYRSGDPVTAFFEQIERALKDGYWIAGQFDYEFGAAMEPHLSDITSDGGAVVRLGVFDAPSDHPPARLLYRNRPVALEMELLWSEADYLSRFDAIQSYLRAGDVYQVNLTFPMRGQIDAEAAHLYASFRRRQPGRYGAIVSLGGPEIISFSPELFFERNGADMRMRPMKGTRSKDASDDMRDDAKSRAENLMIVDLLRNDLSRLCRPGSVKVPELFAVEDYPTLLQMTSQVTGTLRADVAWDDIFRALFPCGSVTGAPKIRAMEIIHDLEAGPRGPYCGSIGFIAPDGRASFSVAIRTAVLDEGSLRYDVGSGVVLDSNGTDEYRECLLKADILAPQPETRFETFLNGPHGPLRADRHADRMGASLPEIEPSDDLQRVRVDLTKDGETRVVLQPFTPTDEPVMLALSRYPLSEDVQRTDIKTSFRDFYDGERDRASAVSGADEVLFRGPDGYLKEGSFTSLFIKTGGRLVTPRGPGLLPGVLRAELLETGQAVEAEVSLEDLKRADAIYVGNSLRGLLRAKLISVEPV